MAADLPVRAPVYKGPPPVVTYFSWTGCYVGGHVGGLWVKKDWSDAVFGGNIGSHDANGWLGGAQVGCNYQVGGWVFGIQGDYAWTDASGSAKRAEPVGHDRVEREGPFVRDRPRRLCLGSLPRLRQGRRRLGEGRVHRDGAGFIATASQTRSGWTVGVGGEYAFTNNFTGFIEYNYYDFGNKNVSFVDQFGGAFGIADIKETKSVVKVGLNWKFGKGPVVAAY